MMLGISYSKLGEDIHVDFFPLSCKYIVSLKIIQLEPG